MSLSFLSNTRGKYLTKKLLELINNKVDAEEGKGLSSNDFTAELKSKLDGIAEGATKVTVDSAVSSSSTNAVQNKAVYTELGKKAATASPTFTGTPKAPTATAGTNDTQIATTAFVTNAVKTAEIDLSGYVKSEDLQEITEAEIESWFKES